MGAIAEYHQSLTAIPEDCKGCKFANVCRGGMPHFRHTKQRGFANRSVYCDSYFEFYEYVITTLLEAGLPRGQLDAALN